MAKGRASLVKTRRLKLRASPRATFLERKGDLPVLKFDPRFAGDRVESTIPFFHTETRLGAPRTSDGEMRSTGKKKPRARKFAFSGQRRTFRDWRKEREWRYPSRFRHRRCKKKSQWSRRLPSQHGTRRSSGGVARGRK